MALFSRIFGARQDELHSHNPINDLAGPGFGDILADALNPMPRLEHHPVGPAGSPKSSRAPKTPRSLARSKGRRVQLNVDVSPELRRELRTAAKRERITLSTLVAGYCRAGLDRGCQ
jgi:hypothetical protein